MDVLISIYVDLHKRHFYYKNIPSLTYQNILKITKLKRGGGRRGGVVIVTRASFVIKLYIYVKVNKKILASHCK